MDVPIFRALWIAASISNVGTWMQDVGQGWLMTSLTLSPLLVALVSTATQVPAVLLGLPSGVLADLADRRRLLLCTQSFMALVAAAMAVATYLHLMTPVGLLWGTLAMGVGSAVNAPAWSAAIPDVVPRSLLGRAVVWNGVSWNVARAVGPALGGLLVSLSGPAAAFLLNALSFLATLAVLLRWPKTPRPHTGPPESFGSAIVAGVRFARHSAELRAVVGRTALFAFFSTGGMALLPLLARTHVKGGPSTYGIMLGCIGVGAIAGAGLRSRLRLLFRSPVLLPGGMALISGAMFLLPRTHGLVPSGGLLVLFGMGWLLVLSCTNTSAQLALPVWVRARGLAMYLLAFSAATAAGSAVSGQLAAEHGLPFAMTVSALGLAFGTIVSTLFPLEDEGEAKDLTSHAWSEAPRLSADGDVHGPVLVMVRYPLGGDADIKAARQAVRSLASIRMRDGATGWRLYLDADDPLVLVEVFTVSSWEEHLRQHHRGTVADRRAFNQAQAACGGGETQVVHLVASP